MKSLTPFGTVFLFFLGLNSAIAGEPRKFHRVDCLLKFDDPSVENATDKSAFIRLIWVDGSFKDGKWLPYDRTKPANHFEIQRSDGNPSAISELEVSILKRVLLDESLFNGCDGNGCHKQITRYWATKIQLKSEAYKIGTGSTGDILHPENTLMDRVFCREIDYADWINGVKPSDTGSSSGK